MAGILEWANDPANMGLLNLSAGLLQASGPSRTPIGVGQALGMGVQQGMQGFQQAQQNQMQQQMFGARMDAARRQQEMEASRAAAMARLAQDPRFAGMGDLLQVAPNAAIEQAFPKAPTPQLVDVPVEGKPGVTRKEWVIPGQGAGTPVGGEKLPVDLNPDVQAARGAVAERGAARVENRINTFTPASEAAQTQFMQSTRQNYEKLRDAPVTLTNLQEAKKIAASDNPFIGSLGDKKAAIAQFFNNNFGTSIAPDELADATALRSRLFERVKDQLKKMDATPSQMQQQKMEDAFGSLTTDPKALGRIIDIADEVIRGQVSIHNKEVEGAEKRGVKFPYNPMIELPGALEQKPAAPTFDDLPPAKQYRGKTLRDTETGKLMRSDGMKWHEVKQ
jgi:hypothetical protein